MDKEPIITIELLRLIEEKSIQAAKAIYSSIEPDEIIIQDGYITVRYISSGCCGDPDEFDDETLTVDDLYKDLETIKKEREEEAERRIMAERERQEREKEKEKERKLLVRKQQYLELKKEFDAN
jgi:hypothetical protein